MRQVATLLCIAFFTAGCATSGSPSLYTLDMSPSDAAGSPVNISVGRLRITEALQNKRILIKKSPTEVEYYAAAQWAAGLDEMLAQKLALEFGPSDPARDTFILSGVLLAFEQVDAPAGGEAHVRLAVELRPEGASHYSKPALAKTYDLRRPASSSTAGGVVESLSDCLEQVAREIVADVAAL